MYSVATLISIRMKKNRIKKNNPPFDEVASCYADKMSKFKL